MAKSPQERPEEPADANATRWSDYLWINLAFFAFLLVLVKVVQASCLAPGDEQTPAIQVVVEETFRFLLLLMGGGFLVVTLFDAAYEFFARRSTEPGADKAPKA